MDSLKIQKILDTFQKNKAKSWEIGTNFYQSMKILAEKIENLAISKILIKQVLRDRFEIWMDNKNITPTTRGKYAAKSTIRQFLQESSALSYIAYSSGDKIEDGVFFNCAPRLFLLRKNEISEHIFFLIVRSVTSLISYEKNMGYSLFICWLIKQNDFHSLNIKHQVFPIQLSKVTRTAWGCEIKEEKVIEYINHFYGKKTNKYGRGKNTYIEAIKELEKRYSFDKLVDMLDKYINNPKSIEMFDEFEKEKYDFENEYLKYCREIDSLRSKIRENAKSLRVDKENEKYSDLENSPTNKTYFQSLEACHIFDICQIKEKVKEYLKNNKKPDFIDWTNNPNNCIFLNSSCHNLFDRLVCWFDPENGKLICRNENKDWVGEQFGNKNLEQIHIKSSILNDEMKKFIKMR